MKISSLPAKQMDGVRDLQPIVRELIARYGADRVISGGGFDGKPTKEGYEAAGALFAKYLADQPVEAAKKILGLNAMKLFGFGL
jgi:predicted TIM-barrel fold metal-dependent hydrolase